MSKTGREPVTSDRSVSAFVALGLLLDGPATGYELAARAERSIAHFWPVARSGLYAELPRLEQRGFVTSQQVTQEHFPDKRIYTATDAGTDAFANWVSHVQLEERPRHPMQLLLFFAAHATDTHAADLLTRWREQADRSRITCARILTEKGIDPIDLAAGQRPDAHSLTALFGLRRAEADLQFLDEAAAALGLPVNVGEATE